LFLSAAGVVFRCTYQPAGRLSQHDKNQPALDCLPQNAHAASPITSAGSEPRRKEALVRLPARSTTKVHPSKAEVDGDSHYAGGAQSYDERRTGALELQGIRVIRFTNSEVLQNFESVCAVVVTALQESTEL
jgi:hypothetical protein